ncbi:MAG: hypothetical protein JXQ75_00090 [Phycisphaerae bacterium]|nr:hypothetical protein [Phycisphaerae bacterium]
MSASVAYDAAGRHSFLAARRILGYGGPRVGGGVSMGSDYYAHSREGRPQEDWHRLDHHLKHTAELAAEFAKPFGWEYWGYPAG